MGSKKGPDFGPAIEAGRKAAEVLKSIVPPELQDLNLEQLVAIGVLQPEQVEDAMREVGADPSLIQSQYKALSALQERVDQEGLSEEDKLAMMNISDKIAAEHKARQAGLRQEMQARGLGGSGQELLMRMQEQQGSAERQRRAGMELAAQKQAAKMQAIQQMAGMAGGMRQQEVAEQAQKAAAANQIAQFNAQQAAQAQYQNWLRNQQIANQNVALRNQMRQWNQIGKSQQQFQNEMALKGAIANAYTGQANMLSQQAMAMPQQTSPWGAIGTVGGAVAGGMMTGWSPQGMSAGAAIGGAAGSQFADGGTAEKMVGHSQSQYKPNVSKRIFKSPQGESYEEHYFDNGPGQVQAPESSEKMVGYADGGTTNGMQQLNPMNNPMQLPQPQQQPIAYADGNPVYDSSYDGPDVPIRDGNLAGDEVPARLNEGELVSNLLMQQNQLNMLRGQPLIRETDPRIDEMLDNGMGEVNEELQDLLVEALRGDEEALSYIQQTDEDIIPSSFGRLESRLRG